MRLNLKGIFLLYFNHLKLFPRCSGIKRASRKQPADFSTCCSSNQCYIIGIAALQQLVYPSSWNQDELIYFVKREQNAFCFWEEDNPVLLLNTHHSFCVPVPFGCSYVSHGGEISHQAFALMSICSAPAVEVREPAGAGTSEWGRNYTQMQRETGERRPTQTSY